MPMHVCFYSPPLFTSHYYYYSLSLIIKENMIDSFWLRIIYIVTTVISLAVAFLILGPRPDGLEGMLDVSGLPLVNASLNSITTLLLILALMLIKQKKIDAHKKVMLTAFGTSALFLISYVIYHWFKAGPKLYMGEWTTFYYTISIYIYPTLTQPLCNISCSSSTI